ncbi:type II toxin-antitoxin system VapC family toxin [soil metagenome]
MTVLLDTHIWLWWLADDPRLPHGAEDVLDDRRNVFFFSAASVWEMAIKSAAGRLRVDADAVAEQTRTSGVNELPVTTSHALQVSRLPSHHADPFDRMLIAQSLVEPMRLMTHDGTLAHYGETILLV